MNFLIVYDPWKPEAGNLARTIRQNLAKRKIEARIHKGAIETNVSRRHDTFGIVLGGDGFVVRNALPFARMRIPLFGINFGTVGFLASVEPEDCQEALEKVLSGKYRIIRTKLLEGMFEKADGSTARFDAVNDVVFFRGLQKFIRMRVEKDNIVLHEGIGGDGVIISSVIGSTAYSLAAGGTVFDSGIGFTPLAIHRVDVRPHIFEEASTMRITCLGGSKALPEEFFLEIDGHGLCGEENHTMIHPGDRATVWSSALEVKRIEPEGFSIIAALQKKLGLSR